MPRRRVVAPGPALRGGACRIDSSTFGDMSHIIREMSEPRQLTPSELALLGWLLTRGAEKTGTDADLASSFLPQLGALRAVSQCGCRCPTIGLTLTPPDLAVHGVSETLADVEGRSPEGSEIGVILRANHGRLNELELYARDGKVPFSIPSEEQLQSFW
jgi:hypothetical protein